MATFTGQRIKDTYEAVLKLKDNTSLSSSDKVVTDGLGNETPLSLSSLEVKSSVDIEATGFKTATGTNLQILLADGSVGNIDDISDGNYIHDQGLSSATWAINHGLGKRVSVSVVDTADTQVFGEVSYIDNNNIIITFNASFSGKAYLN